MFPSAERAFEGELLLPAFQHISQEFPRPQVADVPVAVSQAIHGLNLGNSLQGKRIAIGVGSRGLRDLAVLVEATVQSLRALGAEAFHRSRHGESRRGDGRRST